MNRVVVRITCMLLTGFFVLYVTRDLDRLEGLPATINIRRARTDRDSRIELKENISQGVNVKGYHTIKKILFGDFDNPKNGIVKIVLHTKKRKKATEEQDSYKDKRTAEHNISYHITISATSHKPNKSVNMLTHEGATKYNEETKGNNRKVKLKIEESEDELQCPKNKERSVLRKLLKKWHTLATREGISYYLFFGSLLGYYRNSDLLPWDTDVDVAVDVRYFRTLRDVASPRTFTKHDRVPRLVIQQDLSFPCSGRQRVSCDGRLVNRSVDGCSFQDPMARVVLGGRHIDIFAMYGVNKTLLHEPTQNLSFAKSDIYPLKPCVFLGFNVNCPKNITSVLQRTYGHGFNIPAKMCVDGKWTYRNEVVASSL